MSRRPIHKIRPRAVKRHGQQAVWEAIRDQREFTITNIDRVVDMHRKSITNYVHRLVAGGIVERAADFETNYTYKLVNDTGKDAPRLTKEGGPVIQGAGVQNIWTSMRMLKTFNATDLVANACTSKVEVKIATVKSYITNLVHAGYLREEPVPGPARKRLAVYRLVKDTGPLPPAIQKTKQVYDLNLKKVVYRSGDAS